MKKIIILLAVFVLCVGAICSCVQTDGGEDDGDTYRVMVVADGATVDGENPVRVAHGDDVSFKISLGATYTVREVSHGEYDEATSTLTVRNVTSNLRITLTAVDLGYDASKSYGFFFKGTAKDSCSLKDTSSVKAGTVVTATAGDTGRSFVGWSFGGTAAQGYEIYSKQREISFEISPDVSVNGVTVMLYPNYVDNNVYYYDANGGTVNTSSSNITNSKYYTVTVTGGKVKVNIGNKYFDKVKVASTFWDDGSFVRDGYVLKEYNTKADGTGESYSLGSKYYIEPDGGTAPTLYCIWAEDTAHSAFTYETVKYSLPSGVTAARAPHWVVDGIKITSYTGNDKTVVIPEKINGKYVTAIAAGAFKNKDVETLVMGRRLLLVADGAFSGCSKLKTVYYPNGLYSISDSAFDSATYSSFKNFYVNATMAPRQSTNERGALSIKLARLLYTKDENRVIVVAGSSAHQSLGSQYLETLFDGQYRVVNLGTVRISTGLVYFEALQHFVHEGDVVVLAPENYIGMMGGTELESAVLVDTENMLNFFRYIDISNYTTVLSKFSSYAKGRFKQDPSTYEAICEVPEVDEYGDQQKEIRQKYCNAPGSKEYKYYYEASFTNRFKKVGGDEKAGYQSDSFCSIDDPKYKDQVNRVIALLKSEGAKVFFGYCPTDTEGVIEEARNKEWLAAFDQLIKDTYDFDASVGKAENYIYNHIYAYDCNYHLNDYGRTYHTYQFYVDLCKTLGINDINGMYEFGTDFLGCIFEEGSDGTPLQKVDFLSDK